MKYCPYCGTGLGEDMRFCPKCGKPYADGQTNPHVSGKHIKEVPHTDESNTVAYAVPKKKKRGIFSVLVVVLLLAVIAGGLYFGGVFSPKKELKLSFSDDPATIAKASESVVMLNCYDKNGELYATGSGFAIFEDGVIVTNYHVIEGEVWRVTAETETGLSFECPTVLAYDEDKDLAVLKAKGQPGLMLLTPGSSAALQKGEKLVAVGSPLGLMNSVSTGVFSGYVDDETGRLIQFTAAISHGSSGGALFNDAGEVVGVTFASLEDGQSINFAVPIEDAKALYESHSAAISLEDFYDSFDHTPPIMQVEYLIDHFEELDRLEVVVEGYISYTDGFYNDGKWQYVGIVAKKEDVTNYVCTDGRHPVDIWLAILDQESEGTAIRAYFDLPDMEQFLKRAVPGRHVVIKGTFIAEETVHGRKCNLKDCEFVE